MIESAIKDKISLSDYFKGAPNDLDMYVDSFQWDGEYVSTAGCFVTFEGILLETGGYGTLEGSVTVNSDYTLEFSINQVYY